MTFDILCDLLSNRDDFIEEASIASPIASHASRSRMARTLGASSSQSSPTASTRGSADHPVSEDRSPLRRPFALIDGWRSPPVRTPPRQLRHRPRRARRIRCAARASSLVREMRPPSRENLQRCRCRKLGIPRSPSRSLITSSPHGRTIAPLAPFRRILDGDFEQRNETHDQAREIVRHLENRTLEVRGSIPLGSTRKRKGLAAMRGLFVFRSAAISRRGMVGERLVDGT